MGTRYGQTAGDCNYTTTVLEGEYSFHIEASESVACLGCIPAGTEQLWMDALVRIGDAEGLDFVPLFQVLGAEPVDEAFAGPWLDFTDGSFRISCSNADAEVAGAFPRHETRLVVYHVDLIDAVAEAWSFDASAAPTTIGQPALTKYCRGTTYFAPAQVAATTFGTPAILDRIRVATSAEALGYARN